MADHIVDRYKRPVRLVVDADAGYSEMSVVLSERLREKALENLGRGDRGTIVGVPNKPRTPHRTIRVPDELWDAARAKADERGENLSEVLRAALERYVKRR